MRKEYVHYKYPSALNDSDFDAIFDELGGASKFLKEFGYRQYGHAVQKKFFEVTQAAANKAAEEGELPALPEEIEVGGEGWDFEDFKSQKTFSVDHMHEYARLAIAADRASRQVANKAEVEPLEAEREKNVCLEMELMNQREIAQHWKMKALFPATPPATTGASTAGLMELRARIAEMKEASYTISQYPETAEVVFDSVTEALDEIAAEIEPVGASTVLTDEQTDLAKRLLEKAEKCSDQFNAITITKADLIAICCEANRYYSGMVAWKKSAEAKDQHVAREVAAQAGQVAVPDFRNVTAVKRISDQSLTITFASCASCSKFERAAAPSPAKESK